MTAPTLARATCAPTVLAHSPLELGGWYVDRFGYPWRWVLADGSSSFVYQGRGTIRLGPDAALRIGFDLMPTIPPADAGAAHDYRLDVGSETEWACTWCDHRSASDPAVWS